MKEVKRFPAVPCADILGCEDIDDIQLTDIEQCVSAADFDALLAQRDALEGKLKVAVEALQRITREDLRRMASDVCDEALAQIGPLPLPQTREGGE